MRRRENASFFTLWFSGLGLRAAFAALLCRRFLGHDQLPVDGLVIAALLGAVADSLFLFGVIFFEQEGLIALRARLGHRLVPEDHVAIRVLRTAVEDFSAPRFLDQNLALAPRAGAGHARRLALDEFAFGIA